MSSIRYTNSEANLSHFCWHIPKGYGWKRWSRRMFYERLGLYDQWQIEYYRPKARPRQLRMNFAV